MFNIKCAEVFCQSFENYAIVCVDCDLKTNSFSEFIAHYQDIHCTLQPIIKQEVPEQTESSANNIKCENFEFAAENDIDEDEISNSDEDAQMDDTVEENPLESPKVPCPLCAQFYRNRLTLRKHIRRSHPEFKLPRLNQGDTKITCPHCPDKNYSSRKGLSRHIRAKHADKADSGTIHSSPTEADDAETTTNNNDLPTNTEEFVDLKELVEVKMEEDPTSADDEDDDDESWSESEFKRSFKVGEKALKKQYECPACSKKYINRKSLCVHVRRNHPDVKIPRLNAAPTSKTCPDCPEKTFSSLKALYRHRRHKHAPPERIEYYQCPNCEKQYPTRDSLTQHLRYVHRVGKVEKRFPCKQCDRVFNERYLLNRHEIRHTGQRNFPCTEPKCDLAFYDVKSLNSHRRHVHIGLRNYVCEICGFKTKTAPSLQIHIRTHTGEKPYKCDQCDKRFATSAAVVEHKVIHNSNIRPHVCDICGKSFSRPKALYHHKPLHLNVKKFICKVCGKAYAQQAGLSAHKRQHALENFVEAT